MSLSNVLPVRSRTRPSRLTRTLHRRAMRLPMPRPRQPRGAHDDRRNLQALRQAHRQPRDARRAHQRQAPRTRTSSRAPDTPPVALAPPSNNGLVWEEPRAGRGSSQSDLNFDTIIALVPQLRNNPGKWARVFTWPTKTPAGTMASRLKKTPAVKDIEWTARTMPDRSSALYGRCPEAD